MNVESATHFLQYVTGHVPVRAAPSYLTRTVPGGNASTVWQRTGSGPCAAAHTPRASTVGQPLATQRDCRRAIVWRTCEASLAAADAVDELARVVACAHPLQRTACAPRAPRRPLATCYYARRMTTTSQTADRRTRTLADGNQIPVLGLGVWQIPKGPPTVDAVRWALELGYRHIDTAQAYGNEESVGQAVRDSGIPRDELFITTKFKPSDKDPASEAGRSLKRLGMEYVDLYLVHWPQGGATRAWAGMEHAREAGYTRSIGVSNFEVRELDQVKATATIQPVIDQVQFSPFEFRRALLEGARQRNIVVEAYSPLGTGRHLSTETVVRIAAEIGRTPAQVLLRWCVQRDLVVIPKSTHRERIAENAQIFDFTLTDEYMSALDALDRTNGAERARERKWW